MNKPATKEPSMDEILSSIRQIIADDDAAAAPAPMRPAAAAPIQPEPDVPAAPLTLSAAQIVAQPMPASPEPIRTTDNEAAGADPMLEMPGGEMQLLDPEDVSFEPEPEPDPGPPPAPRAAPPPRPPTSVARAAPMPDPTLSQDLAEEILAPATNAAVQGTMSKLSAVASMGSGSGQTIEGMMRDLMRPMLKEWLDENLPSLVERVVEREIARISRGVK